MGYIGEMAKDYIYAVTPILEDALMDRDLVHRQTAAWTIKHLALGVQGLWHPARRVRAVYWRVYNNLYIAAQDALIPSYPKLEDDAEHCYRRTELELLL